MTQLYNGDYTKWFKKRLKKEKPNIKLLTNTILRPREAIALKCLNCKTTFGRARSIDYIEGEHPCPTCSSKIIGARISTGKFKSHDSFVTKIENIWGKESIKFLSVYTGKNFPIKFECKEGHVTELKRAEDLYAKRRKCICRECSHIETRLKPFKFKHFTIKELKSGERITLFEPYNTYQIQYNGKGLWSIYSSNGKLNLQPDKFGYIKVDIYWQVNDRRQHKATFLHRIVYSMARNKPKLMFKNKRKKEIDHKDRNTRNNRVSNLRLVNKYIQMCNTSVSKITTEKDIKVIHKLRKQGFTYKEIATQFNCHLSLIHLVCKNKIHQPLTKGVII